MTFVNTLSGGFARSKREQRARVSGRVEAYPTETRVVLPDGQLMLTRNASLASAKDLLAAQRAAERRIQSARAQQRAEASTILATI